jgi:predicted ABC-type transport system involved in lysophospholipase L1 biosynthesis ATPase subunit
VVVGGRDLTRASARELAQWRARNVGFVFQFYNLLPVLTRRGTWRCPLLLTRLSRAERAKHVARRSSWWGCPIGPTTIPRSSPAARSSASGSRARS